MPDLPIVNSPAQSVTLRRLIDNLEVINAHLDNADAWQGAEVGGQYIRIEADDILVPTEAQRREYVVALHIFARPVHGHLHDHRWPFAVYPYGAGLPDATPLYEMPWEYAQRSGVITVCSRCPYAIDECRVRHAVHGLRPHMSLTFTDITDPPTRPNRLTIAPLSAEATKVALAQARNAFRQTHSA